MFAYCGNNSVNAIDPSGHAWFGTNTVAINDGGCGYRIWSAIANTPEDQISGMINGQEILPYSGQSIGLGSYGKSGCAFIAIYNAMQLLGDPQSLKSVVDEVFWKHGTVLFGAFGVAPWSMESYFSAHGVEYTGYYTIRNLTENVSEGSIIVFTTMNKKGNLFGGWHAMTALYTCGRYLVFNRYNDREEIREYSSLEEAYSEGMWLYGILINQNQIDHCLCSCYKHVRIICRLRSILWTLSL